MSAYSPQPCSPSILMNPLPPGASPPLASPQAGSSSGGRPRRGSVAVCVSHTAEPPAWYQDPYGSSPPKADITSRSSSHDRWMAEGAGSSDSEDGASVATGQASSGSSNGQSVSFAPLPKGKPRRSNSITIGVASRAHMLSGGGSGGASNGTPNPRQVRYAGPQWYSPGGVVPPDVYTYKDLARGLSSVWRKAKGSTRARRSSEASITSSTSAEHALEMEREAKSKASGIEHIEEAVEEEDEEEVFDSDDELDEHEQRARGRAAGLTMPAGNGSQESSSSEGHESEESGGALSTSATSQGTVEEREQWETDARRRAKGKGKLVRAA